MSLIPRSGFHFPFFFLSLGCLLAVLSSSCDTPSEVESTIPGNQATDVDPRSIIAIQLSNSVTADDTSALDSKNITVTGDLTQGSYAGSLVLADRDKLRRGFTVEEFKASQAGAAPEDANPGEENDAKAAKKNRKDTIVFLLADGTSFKDGETVRVTVSHDVTVNGSPLKKHKTFSFRVLGRAGVGGELRVTSTEPVPGQAQASARPRISAAFNRAVRPDGLADAITVRAAYSGAHAGGDTLFSKTSGNNQVLEASRRLASGDAFLPGEMVTVALSSAITEAGAAGQTSTAKLTPYLFQFQIKPGRIEDGWTPQVPPAAKDSPVAILAADFRAKVDGTELAVVGDEGISLFSQVGDRIWSRVDAPIDLGDPAKGFHVVDAAMDDLKSDGLPEIVVLLSGPQESSVLTFQVTEVGEIEAAGKSRGVPVREAGKMVLADLDANGKPEILFSHATGTYVPAQDEPAKKTGSMTILEEGLVPPDPSEINPADPESLLPKPGFVATHNPIDDFDRSRRMDLADLNSDGKLDLVSETESGVFLYRNIGNAAQKFAFRRVEMLTGRASKFLAPLAWAIADVDADGDQDVLAWDSDGALLYRNRHIAPVTSGTQLPASRGLLAESLPPEPVAGLPILARGAAVQALELNGDGTLDLVILGEDGAVTLLLGSAGAELVFEAVEHVGPGGSPGLAIADLDGDTGLDVAVVAASSGEVRVFTSEGVEAPEVAASSSFRLAPDGAVAEDGSELTDLQAERIRVAVLGNLAEEFTGFSIALDYDEQLLGYLGFETPLAFGGGVASFTLCPDSKGQGCAGNASARMSYLQGTHGGAADGVLLGTFLFSRKAVLVPAVAKIELLSFTGPNNTMFENKLDVVDGAATASLPVELAGEALTIALVPPAPPELTVQCTVFSREGTTLSGRVVWSSPAGTVFEELRVAVGGGVPVLLPGTASSFDFTTTLTGVIQVTVATVDSRERPVSASCQVIGIHEPTVTCGTSGAGDSKANTIHWTATKPVDFFRVYRNGIHVPPTHSGDATVFVDTSPSKNGADNYEVSGSFGGVEGPRGSCAGGPVGDPDANTTLPPEIFETILLGRQNASDPNSIRSSWRNGEGYASIAISVEKVGQAAPVVTEDLDGTRTQFTYAGDPPRGGVKPGQYVFAVTGSSGGRPSETRRSPTVDVPVPVLSASFSCAVDASGSIQVSWQEVWPGYDALKLVIEHRERVGGDLLGTPTEISLDFSTTQHTASGLAPVGVYTFRLVALYGDIGSLPDSLKPRQENLERECDVSFFPRVFTGTVEAGIGLSGIEIPVRADVFGVVKGFHFELEYPAFLTVSSDPRLGLRVDHVGAVPEQFEIVDGSTPGTRKAVVTISGIEITRDADGDGLADGQVVLASLVGSLPVDASLARESPLRFRGMATFSFGGDLNNVPVSQDDHGTLVVRRRFVILDRGTVAAGSPDEVKLAVRTTFTAPPSAPNYRLVALQLHLTWDPALLELLPVTEEDQRDTVLFDKAKNKVIGFMILPNATTLAIANSTGDLKTSWLGFDFGTQTQQYLYPGVDLKLLFVRFRSRVPGDRPATFAKVEFLSAPRPERKPEEELLTAFFPEVAVPSERNLDGFFGGGVQISSTAPAFSVRSISPARGSLLGDNEAVITGSGFRPGGGSQVDLKVQFLRPVAGGDPVVLPVTEILAAESTQVRFKVPDSGLRRTGILSTPVDVEVTLGASRRTLARAYAYEYPRVLSANLASVRSDGGELLILTGAGFAPSSTAAFLVDGAATRVSAQVTKVEADGTKLFLVTPDLRGNEGKEATVEVTVPGVDTFPLPGKLDITGSGGGPTLRFDSITPATATICGGTELTIKGDGFVSLSVQFGALAAQGVNLEDGQTGKVLSPAVGEGTGAVRITIFNVGGAPVSQENAFTFTHPAPPFKRGDVNGNGSVDLADATLLSDMLLGKAVPPPPLNLDAADATDNGVVNGGDVTAILGHLFGGVSFLPEPFASTGLDPTPDGITSCGE